MWTLPRLFLLFCLSGVWAQHVIDTTTTEDEIVDPNSGSRIPVASSSSSQILPVRPPQQVLDTTETQDTIVLGNGQQIPVASSSNTHRVARQFVSQPRVLDTVEVQDTIVHPNGAVVPVARSINTVAAPVVAQPSVPHVVDTVETQDFVVARNGAVVPLTSSQHTQATPIAPAVSSPVIDTVSVQDTIVSPSGAVIPVGSASQSVVSPAARIAYLVPVQPNNQFQFNQPFYNSFHPGFYKRQFQTGVDNETPNRNTTLTDLGAVDTIHSNKSTANVTKVTVTKTNASNVPIGSNRTANVTVLQAESRTLLNRPGTAQITHIASNTTTAEARSIDDDVPISRELHEIYEIQARVDQQNGTVTKNFTSISVNATGVTKKPAEAAPSTQSVGPVFDFTATTLRPAFVQEKEDLKPVHHDHKHDHDHDHKHDDKDDHKNDDEADHKHNEKDDHKHDRKNDHKDGDSSEESSERSHDEEHFPTEEDIQKAETKARSMIQAKSGSVPERTGYDEFKRSETFN